MQNSSTQDYTPSLPAQIFARTHNLKPGWVGLGNQLDGVQILEKEMKDRYEASECRVVFVCVIYVHSDRLPQHSHMVLQHPVTPVFFLRMFSSPGYGRAGADGKLPLNF